MNGALLVFLVVVFLGVASLWFLARWSGVKAHLDSLPSRESAFFQESKRDLRRGRL